ATGSGLQWGRDHLVAETDDVLGRDDLRRAASMGPRPSGRGNSMLASLRRRSWCSFNGAATIWSRKPSVGWAASGAPRRRFNGAATIWSRKLCPRGGDLAGQRHASMGPRPSGRGNLARARADGRFAQMLQWGRDHLVAET